MGLSIDITGRKRGEEAFRASQARLAAGTDLAGLAFYEVDFGAGVVFVDDRFRDSAAFPRNGRRAFGPWSSGWSICTLTTARRCWTSAGSCTTGSWSGSTSSIASCTPIQGERWIHHMACVATRDAAGRAVKSFGVLRDITERRRSEEALRQSYAEITLLKDRLQAESDYLKAEIRVIHPHGEVTGQSPAIKQVLHLVEQVAPTGSSVLVCGETGTGKELVAQAIHRLSPRGSRLMVKVNCAALPSGLVESELFGREKGAFTGALTRQIGRFEVADGSTLFLDEIGELSLEVQAKLLRVLEQGEFERLGSPRTIKVDVRLIAATNRDLADDIRTGRFREDLYYRLNVFPIRVPPLRERAEDIPLLVWAFLEEFSSRMGKKITQVPRATMDALQRRPWPGNVRELRNVLEHAAILTTGKTLRVPMPRRRRSGGGGPDAGRRRTRAHPPDARENGRAHQGTAGRGRGAGAQALDALQPHEEAGHRAAMIRLSPCLTPHGHLVLAAAGDVPELDAVLVERIGQAFARGAGHGLLRLGAGEIGQVLPPVFVRLIPLVKVDSPPVVASSSSPGTVRTAGPADTVKSPCRR